MIGRAARTCYILPVRILAQSTLKTYGIKHPETKVSLERLSRIIKAETWHTTSEVQSSFPKAAVLNDERVRFEVAGGNYRLIVAFKFKSQLAFVKFIGTHAEYDHADALTVSLF